MCSNKCVNDEQLYTTVPVSWLYFLTLKDYGTRAIDDQRELQRKDCLSRWRAVTSRPRKQMITVQELEMTKESYSARTTPLVSLPPFFALDSRW